MGSSAALLKDLKSLVRDNDVLDFAEQYRPLLYPEAKRGTKLARLKDENWTPGVFEMAHSVRQFLPQGIEPEDFDGDLIAEAIGLKLPSPPVSGKLTLHNSNQGKLANAVAIGAAATQNYDLPILGYSGVRIAFRMTAGVSTDLSTAVRAYEDDGTTLEGGPANGLVAMTNANVAPSSAVAPQIFNSGVVATIVSFPFLLGIAKLQARAVNNNVAGQTLTIVYYLID